MKLEIREIRVVSGEFQVLPAETGDQHRGDPRSQLLVLCRYGIVDNQGVVIAQGNASNSISVSAASVKLSESTLEAFQKFFTHMEHDIANALETGGHEQKQPGHLESLLAGLP